MEESNENAHTNMCWEPGETAIVPIGIPRHTGSSRLGDLVPINRRLLWSFYTMEQLYLTYKSCIPYVA